MYIILTYRLIFVGFGFTKLTMDDKISKIEYTSIQSQLAMHDQNLMKLV